MHRRHFNTNKRERGGANLINFAIRYNLFLSLANLLFELREIKMDDQYEMSLARHLSALNNRIYLSFLAFSYLYFGLQRIGSGEKFST